MNLEERFLWIILGAAVMLLVCALISAICALLVPASRSLGGAPPAFPPIPPFQPLERDAPRVFLYDSRGMEIHEASPPPPQP